MTDITTVTSNTAATEPYTYFKKSPEKDNKYIEIFFLKRTKLYEFKYSQSLRTLNKYKGLHKGDTQNVLNSHIYRVNTRSREKYIKHLASQRQEQCFFSNFLTNRPFLKKNNLIS